MVQGKMDLVAVQVEVMKGVENCQVMGLWGTKEACMSVGRQSEDWKELLGVCLPFRFSQCLKKV